MMKAAVAQRMGVDEDDLDDAEIDFVRDEQEWLIESAKAYLAEDDLGFWAAGERRRADAILGEARPVDLDLGTVRRRLELCLMDYRIRIDAERRNGRK